MAQSDWIICPTCSGDGSHSRNLGSFSAEEFLREFDEDERADYFAGAYNSRCDTCKGSGKIRDDDEAAEARHEHRVKFDSLPDDPRFAWRNEY